jgi:hypothetical protein
MATISGAMAAHARNVQLGSGKITTCIPPDRAASSHALKWSRDEAALTAVG